MFMTIVFFIYIFFNVMIVPVLFILAVSCHFPSLTRRLQHFRNLTPRCPIDKTTASEPCSVVPVLVQKSAPAEVETTSPLAALLIHTD